MPLLRVIARHAAPADLLAGDLAMVNAAACHTAGAAAGTAPTLVARLVDAHPTRS